MLDKETKQARKQEKLVNKKIEQERIRIHKAELQKQKLALQENKVAPEDSYISLKNVNKIYDNHVQAVFDFNLDIKPNEFIVLVGPSGCGKSTTLRMIAGLEDITSGDLYIAGDYSNMVQAKNRNIAMVFQSYALYPHLTVYENMAFSLKLRKVKRPLLDENGNQIIGIDQQALKEANDALHINTQKLQKLEAKVQKLQNKELSEEGKVELEKLEIKIVETKKFIDNSNEAIQYYSNTEIPLYQFTKMDKEEIRERIYKAADILQIKEYLSRKPSQLSGGQMQRVALGRAIVRDTNIFLMDEPLSNLDAKLRVSMRSEIIKLHQNLGATTIYVTHDQTEAMTMATRIVVMNKGYIQQIGTPAEIYNKPANTFVATFIGSPSMNLIDTKLNGYKTIDFKDGYKIQLTEEISRICRDFYEKGLESAQAELEQNELNNLEKLDLLEKIATLKELETNSSKEEIRKQNELEKLSKLLEINEKANIRRSELINIIENYSKFIKENSAEVIFGIRPDDIIETSEITKKNIPSDPMKLKVIVSELLGNQYFIHSNFNDIEMIYTIPSDNVVGSGDELEVSFDLNKFHIFDNVTKKIIH